MNIEKKPYYMLVYPGIALCFAIALPAWMLGRALPIVGGPVFGILIGMALAPFLTKKKELASSFEPGVKFTSKKLLQYSIILLGFEMNLFHVLRVGGQSLLIMLFTLSSAFFMAYLLGSKLKLHGKMTVLIGVGTSICGGSAIAATAPVIQAEDEDVAHAISTIFLFNVVAVFLFPTLGRLMGLSDMGFGMWAGTAINDTSSVVAAGTAWSSFAGNNTALVFATIVKLTRTLMIVPITLFLALYMARKSRLESSESSFQLKKVFPWFVLGFIGTAILSTFLPIPGELSEKLVTTGKYIIIMAMAAIGLNTHLGKLLRNGWRPILLGLGCWFTVAVVSLLVQFATRLL